MRRLALLAASLILALGVAGPVAASAPTRCAITVSPASGTSTDSYRITGTGFPPGSFEQFTDVHIGVVRAGDGRLMPTLFLVLVPWGGGSFYVDYHFDYSGEERLSPLEPGRYRAEARANGHECVAFSSFIVTH